MSTPDTPQDDQGSLRVDGRGGMAFSGDASCLGLDEVIQFLAANDLEGILTLKAQRRSLRLYFRNGRVLYPYVAEDARPGTLAPHVVDDVFDRAAQLRQRAEGRLSRENVDDIWARGAQLRAGLRWDHLARTLDQVLEADDPKFDFTPGPLPDNVLRSVQGGRGIQLDPQTLLMELARRRDETRGDDNPLRLPSREELHAPAPQRTLRGSLDGIGLATLLQALGTGRRSGTLTVSAEHQHETLHFDDGRVFVLRLHDADAQAWVDDLLGDHELSLADDSEPQALDAERVQEQFLSLLFWEGAEFVFLQGDPPESLTQAQRIPLQTDRFLMEAMRRLSLWDELRTQLDPTTPLAFTDSSLKLQAIRDGHLPEVVTLIDGRLRFDDLVRASGHNHLDVGQTLSTLLEQNLLAPA